MKSKKVLIIGLVWPEPDSSAAGTRLIQLTELLLAENYTLIFASAASKGPYSFDLKSLGVTEKAIRLNENTFDNFLLETNPDLVIYDRFISEEQYGWRVREHCPMAISILDTEDLHCLRLARQQAVKKQQVFDLSAILAHPIGCREIASILRCDLSLIISEVEMQILQDEFRIDPGLLCYLPFLENELVPQEINEWPGFEERTGFTFIGNFLHEPNWHTLQTLKTIIWPVLNKLVPEAEMHIYGAYTTEKVLQLHQPKQKFYIHGRADKASEAVSRHRILLAPIQFGAGLKGKLIQAMQTGTPSVTTSTGAEGVNGDLAWNGFITDDLTAFSRLAASLYTNQELWHQSQQNGINILNRRFDKYHASRPFLNKIDAIVADLQQHRRYHYLGTILHSQQLSSTKYMSLWIEQKNASNKAEKIHKAN